MITEFSTDDQKLVSLFSLFMSTILLLHEIICRNFSFQEVFTCQVSYQTSGAVEILLGRQSSKKKDFLVPKKVCSGLLA